jgi:hypothetical protein
MAKDFNASVTAALNGLTVGNAICATATNKLIGSIRTRGAKLDIDMHTAAIAALTLSSLHRDANSAALLLNAMPKGSRAETLSKWFQDFGNIIVTKDAKTKAFKCKMKAQDDCAPVDLARAQATPFWTKPEQVTGSFNDLLFANAVAALIKRAKGDNAELSDAARTALADLDKANAKLAKVLKAANA